VLVLAWAVATAAALLPAWRASRMQVHDALAQG
jgi:ABC-type lipoprotein release transport system permease subunit